MRGGDHELLTQAEIDALLREVGEEPEREGCRAEALPEVFWAAWGAALRKAGSDWNLDLGSDANGEISRSTLKRGEEGLPRQMLMISWALEQGRWAAVGFHSETEGLAGREDLVAFGRAVAGALGESFGVSGDAEVVVLEGEGDTSLLPEQTEVFTIRWPVSGRKMTCFGVLPVSLAEEWAKALAESGARAPVAEEMEYPQLEEVSGETGTGSSLELLYDIPLEVAVVLGRSRKRVREILGMGPGSVVELDKLAGEAVEVLVNGRLVARGEVVVIDEHFGVRITDVISRSERLEQLR